MSAMEAAATRRGLTVDPLVQRRQGWRVEEERAACQAGPQVITIVSVAGWSTRFRRLLPGSISCLTSAALHLIVLVTTAWITCASQEANSAPMQIVASVVSAQELEEVVTFAMPDDESRAELSQNGWKEFESILDDPGGTDGGIPAIQLAVFASTVTAGDSDRLPGDSAGEGHGVAGSGEGAGTIEGQAEESSTDFFGVQASGRSFVFVCDCSRSMTGRKWLELQRELSRCIGELGRDKSFYLVFFDGEMHRMFEPSFSEESMLPATDDNVEKARIWLSGMSVGPNTEPYESMKFAVSLAPDAVFFLTDGEFSDYTAPYLREFNKKRKSAGKPLVAIHTIGFFSQKGRMVLERIAKDSGGTYKFIAEPHVAKAKRRSWNVVAPAPTGLRFGPAMPSLPVRPRSDG